MTDLSQPDKGPASIQSQNELVTTTVPQELENYWVDALVALGADLEQAKPLFEDLLAAHSDSSRAYHNLNHLNAMRQFLAEHVALLTRPHEVALAVLYHDYVYDSMAKDNEEQSAVTAREQLQRLGISEAAIEFIEDLILSTKKHQVIRPGSDNELFLDADLSILAVEPERYIAYTEAIREEYSWVPEADYRSGRSAVMETFLGREQIYYSTPVRAALEDKARQNLRAEINLLTQ